jgi:hypothetical protein
MTLLPMKSRMLLGRECLKVLWTVVISLGVAVMHMLTLTQSTTEFPFGDEAVLKNVTASISEMMSWHVNSDVAILGMPASLPCWMTCTELAAVPVSMKSRLGESVKPSSGSNGLADHDFGGFSASALALSKRNVISGRRDVSIVSKPRRHSWRIA